MSRAFLALSALALVSCGSVFAAPLTLSGYSENFDSIGVSGTVPPTDWSLKTGPSGTSNSTWTNATGITPAGVAALIATPGALTVVTTPTANQNNGYNAAASASATSARVIATAPTTVSGGAIQLSLTNATGAALNSINLSYDTIRYAAVGSANELPGYQVFYSLDGTTWNNVASLNPTLAGPGGVLVPNSVGTTSVASAPVSLASAWNNSATLLLRWVDDNAVQTSPDQIIGLNNVSITPVTGGDVPEPAALSMLALAAIPMLRRRAK